MIFVTLGSQKFQFNRLLKELDELVKEGKVEDEIFAQIGYSDYKPQNYKYKDFLTRDEFQDIINKCDIVITHGGTGAIITALKQKKKVIAIPRLAKYGEHVDDHQIQLLREFEQLNLIESVYNIDDIENVIKSIQYKKNKNYESNTDLIIESIRNNIERE